MDEKEQKLTFARALIRDETAPLKAAFAVFGTHNMSAAMNASQRWPYDPIVLAEMERLKETHGKRHFMQSLEQTAEDILSKARQAWEDDDRRTYFLLMKLFNETMGYIQKPGMTINNNQVLGGHIAEVPTFGAESNWEKQAAVSQTELTQWGKKSVN